MEVLKEKQVKKFAFYGFFKNLKFFEPYLLIYFLNNQLDFFQIGILLSIKEVIVYIFEVPSGIIADYYGKKNELMWCFVFYIISFFIFFISKNFVLMIFAMIFFGLGKAFRSGTHKAMIYQWLEKNDIFHQKARVYGYTRSYSKIGSAISSFMAIGIILYAKDYHLIFLFSIIPYIIDFLLIMSYPSYLNQKEESVLSIKKMWQLAIKQIKSIFGNHHLNFMIINSSVYNGVFKMIKDYIQPILGIFLLASLPKLSIGNEKEIYLGILYGIFAIFSSYVSRKSYVIKEKFTSKKVLNRSFALLSGLFLLIAVAIKYEVVVIIILSYFYLYISKNFRKPLFVDYCGDHMKREERATAMSVNSQLESTTVILFSPILGFVVDQFGIATMFVLLGIIILFANLLLANKNK